MKFGSVCSGIEAASAAWHGLGWTAAWLAEVDVAASNVLAHRLGATAPRYPMAGTEKAIGKYRWGKSVVNWGDMTRLPDLVRNGEAEAPDVFCGGVPCQSFSVAGLRKGLNDARGNLTLTFVEIANEIDLKRVENGDEPSIIFFENVPGILSDKTNAFGCLLAGLAGEDVPLEPSGKRWSDTGCVIGPQRTVAWRKLDAQYFGLAQRRERVFVVASAREGFDPVEILFEFDGVRRDSAPSREAWEEITHPVAPSLTSSGRGVERAGESRGQDPVVACERPGRAAGVTSAIAIQERAIADTNTGPGGKGWRDDDCAYTTEAHYRPQYVCYEVAPQWWDGSPVSQTLDAVLHKGQTMPEKNRFPAVLQPIAFHPTQDPIWNVDRTHALGCGSSSGQASVATYGNAGHFGSMRDVGVSDPLRVKGGDTGNGGESLVVCVTGDRTHALNTANNGKGCSEDGTGRGVPTVAVGLRGREGGGTIEVGDEVQGTLRASGGGDKPHVFTEMAVRRLMPVEAERLQGFFDWWTAVPTTPVSKANQSKAREAMEAGDQSFCEFDGVIFNVAADGPRYKQLGNSWAVPVVSWIGARIDSHVRALDSHTIKGSLDPASAIWLTVP